MGSAASVAQPSSRSLASAIASRWPRPSVAATDRKSSSRQQASLNPSRPARPLPQLAYLRGNGQIESPRCHGKVKYYLTYA
jgi:hypothetical protein